MDTLSPQALIFLGYALLLLPGLAVLSRGGEAETEGAHQEDGAEGSRVSMYVGSLFVLGGLLTLSVLAGREVGVELFSVRSLRAWDWLLAFVILGIAYATNAVTVSWMSEAERRAGVAFIPQTRPEWTVFSLAALLGGIAEEAAYRGVVVVLLTRATGSAWVAVGLSVVAFAIGHAGQGRKAVVAVAFGALTMHLLVELTNTLLLAMAVHVVYDLTAVAWGARRIAREGVEALVKRPAARDPGEGGGN